MKASTANVEAILKYISAMKRNALARLDRGEKPEVIELYKEACGFCQSQINFFMLKNETKHFLNIPIDIVELTPEELASLVKKGAITQAMMDNKITIIDRIIPVEKNSIIGQELKVKSKQWSKKTGNPDAILDLTPMWLHYGTQEVIGVGYRGHKNLRMLVDPVKNKKREELFKRNYSLILGKPCDAVMCDVSQIVKINSKRYKKMG